MTIRDKILTVVLGVFFFIIFYILFVVVLAAAPPYAYGESTCYCDLSEEYLEVECCRRSLVWPGEVTGLPCYGPLCTLPDGYNCTCNAPPVEERCEFLCHQWAVWVGGEQQAQGMSIQVVPERSLCYDQEFPFDEVAGRPFGEIYVEVFQGSGGFDGCVQDNALLHWEASFATFRQMTGQIDALQMINDDLAAERDLCNEQLESCLNPAQPRCDNTEDFVDGPGNALYKPVSESTGRVLVLMPNNYCVPVETTMWHNGEQIDTARIRTCEANGNRAHWDFSRRCEDYPNGLIVQFTFPDGFTDCRVVPFSCTRYD